MKKRTWMVVLTILKGTLVQATTPAETLLNINSEGNHSFESLGPDFVVPLTVVPTRGKLHLFNYNQAERMGMSLPDKAALEKLLVDNFSFRYEKDSKDPKAKKVFATYYQDSDGREVGHARGDGRLAWVKELVFRGADGRYHYMDVTVKGIGATPLAPSKKVMQDHNDGILGREEAVLSFMTSELAVQSNLDSTSDLAVILVEQRVPGTEQPIPGTEQAYSVRVGNHRRIGHFRYYSGLYMKEADKERKEKALKNLQKFAEYSIVRDLGLAPTAKVGDEELKAYLHKFVVNLATEFAARADSHFLQTSSTAGNMTTLGSMIDHSTVTLTSRAIIATNAKNVSLKDPTKFISEMSRYLDPLFADAKNKVPPYRLLGLYKKTYESEFLRRSFIRMGLSEEEISAILDPVKPKDLDRACQNKLELKKLMKTPEYRKYHRANSLREKFLNLFKQINETPSSESIGLSVGAKDQKGVFALYPSRYILAHGMQFDEDCEDFKGGTIKEMFQYHFTLGALKKEWEATLSDLCQVLTDGMQDPGKKFDAWSRNALRRSPLRPKHIIDEIGTRMERILPHLDATDNFEILSKKLLQAISTLKDPELPKRDYVNSNPQGAQLLHSDEGGGVDSCPQPATKQLAPLEKETKTLRKEAIAIREALGSDSDSDDDVFEDCREAPAEVLTGLSK